MSTVQTVEPDPRDLLAPEQGTVLNRAAQLLREGARDVLRLDARPGEGLAWWPHVAFAGGTLDFEVRGKDEPQRSFVGVAFHGAQEGDALSYETVYFRPFNFRAEAPESRRHMVQYVAPPEFPWQRLRAEQPDRFEAPIEPIPDPNGWFAARVEVDERTVRVYVAGSATPSLVVERLRRRPSGWVGYWVGNGSGGDFAALTLTPADPRGPR